MILKSSINFNLILDGDKFSLIFFNKTLFFLPPPQSNTSFIISLEFLRDKDNSSPIILAVKSVKVVTPSSKFNPRTKEISKSFVSNERFFIISIHI